MSDSAHAALGAVTVTTLGASNLIAWASSFDAAAVAGTITILGLAGIGIVTRAIKEISKSRSEAWADRVRLEMQIAADQEKLNANSLSHKLATLQATIDTANSRVEDANKKLHDAANERNVENLRHREEMDRLTKQLEIATKQLEETNEELHAARAENRALLAKIELMQKQVTANSQDIKTLAEQRAGDAA